MEKKTWKEIRNERVTAVKKTLAEIDNTPVWLENIREWCEKKQGSSASDTLQDVMCYLEWMFDPEKGDIFNELIDWVQEKEKL